MSAVGRVLSQEIRKGLQIFKSYVIKEGRTLSMMSTAAMSSEAAIEEKSTNEEPVENEQLRQRGTNDEGGSEPPPEFRYVYPEFLPDPNPAMRNWLREKMERMDMLARRSVIDIPEFYVGSVVGVTYMEPHAPGKSNRFVGICIERTGCGLRNKFILRNVIDNQGVEIIFDTYDPSIKKIECLRLEKRLDERLAYLRDAAPEYSTFPMNMEAEILPLGSPVPVNDLQVVLNPRPWREKWERQNLKGVKDIFVGYRRWKKAVKAQRPWEKYDLMKIYRETIPEEEQKEIYAGVYSELHNLEIIRRKMNRKRSFQRPKKSA